MKPKVLFEIRKKKSTKPLNKTKTCRFGRGVYQVPNKFYKPTDFCKIKFLGTC